MPKFDFLVNDQGQTIRDMRNVSMDDWGTPQVDQFSSPLGHEPNFVMRGQLPQWAPGEFDEWKQAHTLGVPTLYGKLMQRRYNNRNLLPYSGQAENEESAIAQQYPAFAHLKKSYGVK